MPSKFEAGDLVIIHQDPRFPLPGNLRIYHGRKGKVICEVGKDDYIVEIPENVGFGFVTRIISAQNLILYVEPRTITALFALDEGMNIVAVREYGYGSPPTERDIYKFLEETNAKYIDVRILYTRSD